ncbi:S-adenosyl-L-methionine-dependent methyltransferase [Metschnikowia bicuspidata var. bicuspidata NRRL YB-4993]|uniref:S-adenosyl-L-methionine-dependent methyltransferase n=1 Tax=Metschnikowia bicuspidata var. bicuspidata NRRL YB-4993 TaxID=869754 RepID=A0A1A0HID0_9ASCO|nr:S-adenosyl-L-methionine-dependent methyltransferase [Metschnikowia bicuspidata var. bicuspidata NRRL YB-4993]OBA23756.1 S-adenosyl-L-methionine-dependent methyltransferase [Metschnikowia bicuspidata var. bicuspidata NRRL YB-4993]
MKLYFEAEKFLKGGERGLKTRIFNAKLSNSPKHIYALVISALKYKEYIQHIVRKARLKDAPELKKLKVSEALLALLVYDFLFSAKGRIQLGKHPVKDAFLANKTRMQAELTKLKLKHGVKSVAELPMKSGLDDDETPVRWIRINTIKLNAAAFFKKHPFFAELTAVDDLAQITGPGVIFKDPYIQNLYGIHPREKLTNTSAYLHGEVIIQDRASCFPGEILFNDPSDVHTQIIDATAAPGNKTTHAASFVAHSENSVVFAFERDDKRVKVLKMMCEKATGKLKKGLIHPTHADFTTVLPQDFPQVSGLIVDPSCSGSGIFGRAIEDALEQAKEDIDTERLQKLAAFQFTIMKHALSFPKARKVVYSTCSIHPHENERVVVDLLRDVAVQAQGWHLAPRDHVIALWPRRGWKEEFTSLCEGDDDRCSELAGGCVRSVPKEDGGIGFFAACFVRDEQ